MEHGPKRISRKDLLKLASGAIIGVAAEKFDFFGKTIGPAQITLRKISGDGMLFTDKERPDGKRINIRHEDNSSMCPFVVEWERRRFNDEGLRIGMQTSAVAIDLPDFKELTPTEMKKWLSLAHEIRTNKSNIGLKKPDLIHLKIDPDGQIAKCQQITPLSYWFDNALLRKGYHQATRIQSCSTAAMEQAQAIIHEGATRFSDSSNWFCDPEHYHDLLGMAEDNMGAFNSLKSNANLVNVPAEVIKSIEYKSKHLHGGPSVRKLRERLINEDYLVPVPVPSAGEIELLAHHTIVEKRGDQQKFYDLFSDDEFLVLINLTESSQKTAFIVNLNGSSTKLNKRFNRERYPKGTYPSMLPDAWILEPEEPFCPSSL